MYLDLQVVINVAVNALVLGLLDIERQVEGGGGLSCKADDREAVGAVGGYLELNGGVVEADRLSDVLAHCLVAVIAEDKDAVLDSVGEVMQGKTQLCKRAEHTV